MTSQPSELNMSTEHHTYLPELDTGQSIPAVRCERVSKYFGGVGALRDVSLELHNGQVVCLVGDNGAGKSTLVKLLGGIHSPDAGELWLGDEKVDRLHPLQARNWGIETVHQDLALCDNLNAPANVMLGQEPVHFKLGPIRVLDNRTSLKISQERIREIGVEPPDWQSAVRRLSGGQRQAIAIARATIRGHRLVMLDEPTAALGVAQTQATLDLVRRVARQGVAVLMISHNLDDVFAVADRIAVLRLGTIVLNARAGDTSREEVVAKMTGVRVGTSASEIDDLPAAGDGRGLAR